MLCTLAAVFVVVFVMLIVYVVFVTFFMWSLCFCVVQVGSKAADMETDGHETEHFLVDHPRWVTLWNDGESLYVPLDALVRLPRSASIHFFAPHCVDTNGIRQRSSVTPCKRQPDCRSR